mgnify:CR=1 FL=1
MGEIILFSILGFFASIIDGCIGMAYGTILASIFALNGVPLLVSSASIHFSEIFTTLASGLSHITFKNVDFKTQNITLIGKSNQLAYGTALAVAQKKVETYHFDVRKNLLKFDDVMNDQRKAIYEQRKELMLSSSVSDTLAEMRLDTIQNVIYDLAPERSNPEDWSAELLSKEVSRIFAIDVPFSSWVNELGITPETMVERLDNLLQKDIDAKMSILPEDVKNNLEKSILNLKIL